MADAPPDLSPDVQAKLADIAKTLADNSSWVQTQADGTDKVVKLKPEDVSKALEEAVKAPNDAKTNADLSNVADSLARHVNSSSQDRDPNAREVAMAQIPGGNAINWDVRSATSILGDNNGNGEDVASKVGLNKTLTADLKTIAQEANGAPAPETHKPQPQPDDEERDRIAAQRARDAQDNADRLHSDMQDVATAIKHRTDGNWMTPHERLQQMQHDAAVDARLMEGVKHLFSHGHHDVDSPAAPAATPNGPSAGGLGRH